MEVRAIFVFLQKISNLLNLLINCCKKNSHNFLHQNIIDSSTSIPYAYSTVPSIHYSIHDSVTTNIPEDIILF